MIFEPNDYKFSQFLSSPGFLKTDVPDVHVQSFGCFTNSISFQENASDDVAASTGQMFYFIIYKCDKFGVNGFLGDALVVFKIQEKQAF